MSAKEVSRIKELLVSLKSLDQKLSKEPQSRRIQSVLETYFLKRREILAEIHTLDSGVQNTDRDQDYTQLINDINGLNKAIATKLEKFGFIRDQQISEDEDISPEDKSSENKPSTSKASENKPSAPIPSFSMGSNSMNLEQILLLLAQTQQQLTSTHIGKPRQEVPKLKISEFDGNVKNFHQFKDQFTRAIENLGWNSIELFLYLKSFLKGEALAAVSTLQTTDRSYEMAWEILEKRFDNRRKLIELCVRELGSEEFKLKPNDSVSGRKFITASTMLFNNIQQNETTIEELVMELILPKLDECSRSKFEDDIGYHNEKITPTLDQLQNFMEKQIRIWENQSHHYKPKQTPTKSRVFNVNNGECFLCGKEHKTMDCPTILGSMDRIKLAMSKKLCIYCLDHKYVMGVGCKQRSKLRCGICKGAHISIMHPNQRNYNRENSNDENTIVQFSKGNDSKAAVLPTAIVEIVQNSRKFPVRCLVDICAERTYVSENIVQKLGLKKRKADITFVGLNGIHGGSKSYVELPLNLNPETNKPKTMVNALVVPKITGNLRYAKLPQNEELEGLKLADPYQDHPSVVGILLGGDIAAELFVRNLPNKITKQGYLLQPTKLGWIVSGGRSDKNQISTFITLTEMNEKIIRDRNLHEQIREFYDLPDKDSLESEDYKRIEEVYSTKTYRLNNGRYVVPIPWKNEGLELGHSFRRAVKLFTSQERKWTKDITHYKMSNEFMTEYESLGHMTEIKGEENYDSSRCYYIPYHSIIREGALTTKLRNVFNASMPTSNGVSLNDLMFEGPKLQTSIRDIILKARSFRYIYSADIEKMFRQIMIIPEDRDLQRIVWRSNEDKALSIFALNTITYGTDSAPYLAIRTLHQCADDNASLEIANIIKKSFYMDDILYGADSINEAKQQISSIINTMNAGKFPLTKWMSNCPEVLSEIPDSNKISSYMDKDSSLIKMLGLNYNFLEDDFKINLKADLKVIPTKRGISSVASSFYDPLGFILPFIMSLRIFLQKVWRLQVDWDEIISPEVIVEFDEKLKGVECLNNIRIPRYIERDEENKLELIGFSDASSHAYAAVIYGRVKLDGQYRVTLIASKGNVAKNKTPLVVESRQTTIPKLELEALLTLAELFKIVLPQFSHRNVTIKAYVDSKVVLGWVKSKKRLEKKFVERRVKKIHKVLSPDNIFYVKSEENPADAASRGLSAEKLSNCSLWFNGPDWLRNGEEPTEIPIIEESTTLMITNDDPPEDLFEKYSSWSLILRIMTLILSWKILRPGKLDADIVQMSKRKLIQYYQILYLGTELEALKRNVPVPKTSWLYKLSPFIDENGLMRVGGRLNNATNLSLDQRHPIIIPKCHALELYIRHLHKTNGHASMSLMMQLIYSEYWIPGVKKHIKKCIYSCPTCIRWNAKVIQPEMAQLPSERITPSSTFEKIGVDLAGPFTIKASPLKFDRTIKVWIGLFICLSTKAIHLELLTSLSTENFLAALSRFCNRRGVCKEIWSDNGTNFVGANKLIKDLWAKIQKDAEKQTTIQEIKWKFIPRHSPSFGGLWESGVKSMKYFIKRMTSVTNLTYEEFVTLLCKVESLLNSRPICPHPLMPNEELALTPFNFINFRKPMVSPMDGSNRTPLTKKWFTIWQIQNQFWERYQAEYLKELQKKTKWIKQKPNLEVDDVVIIKEPSLVPGDWKLGRVKETYPDPQGVVRKVLVIESNKKEKTQAVNQLVLLNKETTQETSNQITTRGRGKNISLVHLCLFIVCAVICPVNAVENLTNTTNMIQVLNDGIYKEFLGRLKIKAIDLDLPVDTGFNINTDLAAINHTTFAFLEECLDYLNYFPEMELFCYPLSKNLTKHAIDVSMMLHNLYNEITGSQEQSRDSSQSKSREKRKINFSRLNMGKRTGNAAGNAAATNVARVTQNAMRTAGNAVQTAMNGVRPVVNFLRTSTTLKRSTEILLDYVITPLGIAAVIADQIRMNEMESRLQGLQYSLNAKTATYPNIEEALKTRGEYRELVTSLSRTTLRVIDILQEIKHSYDALKDLKPLKEIKKCLEGSKYSQFALNDTTENLMKSLTAVRNISDTGEIIFTYKISLMHKEKLNYYALMSVPSPDGYTLKLPNGRYFQKIATNLGNTNYVDVTGMDLTEMILPTTYLFKPSNSKFKELDPCIISIFQNDPTAGLCKTFKEPCFPTDKLYSVNKTHVFLLPGCKLNVQLTCNEISQNIPNKPMYIDITGCDLEAISLFVLDHTHHVVKRNSPNKESFNNHTLYFVERTSIIRPEVHQPTLIDLTLGIEDESLRTILIAIFIVGCIVLTIIKLFIFIRRRQMQQNNRRQESLVPSIPLVTLDLNF